MSTVLTIERTEEKLLDMDFSPKMRDGDEITGIHDVEAFFDEELTQSASAVIEFSDFSSDGQRLQFMATENGAEVGAQHFVRARVSTTSDPMLVGRGVLIVNQ